MDCQSHCHFQVWCSGAASSMKRERVQLLCDLPKLQQQTINSLGITCSTNPSIYIPINTMTDKSAIGSKELQRGQARSHAKRSLDSDDNTH